MVHFLKRANYTTFFSSIFFCKSLTHSHSIFIINNIHTRLNNLRKKKKELMPFICRFKVANTFLVHVMSENLSFFLKKHGASVNSSMLNHLISYIRKSSSPVYSHMRILIYCLSAIGFAWIVIDLIRIS